MIKNNFQFLSPKLLSILQSTTEAKINYKTSRDNLPIPIYNNNVLHSTYYPLKDGEKLINKNDIKDVGIAIGIGAAYHLVELLKYNRNIIGIPIDYSILKNILTVIDLSKYFIKENLILITEDEIIAYFNFFKYKDYFFIIHPVLEKLFSSKVLQIIKNIIANLKEALLEVNTQRAFGKLWFRNIIKNIIYFYEDKFDFTPLIIDKKPIFVIGAGPSLEQNIDTIKKYKNEIFLAASDTSLKILYSHHIYPDVCMSFDAQVYSYLHFAGVKKDFRLFTDFTSSLKNFEKQTMLFSNHPMNLIFKKAGWDTVMLPSLTRNIGGAMIDFFSLYFPSYPIITTGIDYSIYKSKMYSSGTYLNDYQIINSNYFHPDNNIDCLLLNKDKITKNINEWKATDLLLQYSKSLTKTKMIYSISDSPFTPFNKIKNIEDIILPSKKLDKTILEFNKPTISKKKFLNLFKKEFLVNTEFANSYFLSTKKSPNDSEIKKIIAEIEKII